VTFDPCDDCGSPLVPVLLFSIIVWSGPIILGAIRRHVADDSAREARLAKAQLITTVIAVLMTAWGILR